jgi:glucose/arabinose dehydrogenase
MRFFSYSFLLVFSLSSIVFAQKKMKIGYELIVKDLDIPWGFSFLPDNSILITEKEGELIHFKNGTKK